MTTLRELLAKIARRLRAHRIAGAAAACCMLAACTNTPSITSATVSVQQFIAAIAKMSTADVQAGIDELIAAGAASPTGPLPLQDSLACAYWIKAAIPQAVQIVNGGLPTNTAVGPYSLFIEGKIGALDIQGVASQAQSNFINQFNHYGCGAAFAGDANAFMVFAAKIGFNLVPGGGAITNLIPGL